MARKLEVQIVGDSRSLERAFGRASKSSATFGKSLARFGKAAAVGVGAGLAVAAVATKKFVDAATEALKSQRSMETQLKALGIGYGAHAKTIDQTIAKHSRLAAIDDEELQAAFTRIVRVTGNVTSALRLNALAADIARGRDMDLATAAELVGKVHAGKIGILGRYGIVLDKNATATEALTELERRFKGQAEAAATGQERLAIATENVQEAIGQRLLPKLTPLLNRLADWATRLAENQKLLGFVDKAVDAVADGAERAAALFVRNWPQIKGFIKDAWEAGKGLASALSKVSKFTHGVIEATLGWKLAGSFIISGLMAKRVIGIAKAFVVLAGAAGIGSATAAVGLLHSKLLKLAGLVTVVTVLVKVVSDLTGFGGGKLTGEVWDPKVGAYKGTPEWYEKTGTRMPGTTGPIRRRPPKQIGSFIGSELAMTPWVNLLAPSRIAAGGGRGRAGAAGGGGGGGGGKEATLDRAELARQRNRFRWFAGHLDRIMSGEVQAKLKTRLASIRGDMSKVTTDEDTDKVRGRLDRFGDVFKRQIAKQMERARQELERQRARMQAAFARVSEKLGAAFDRMRGKLRTPGEGELEAIRARREQEDLAQAVTEAELDLAKAREEGDPRAIAEAERRLARAREDIVIASLERQASAEREALDDQTTALREALGARLQALEDQLLREPHKWKEIMGSVSAVLSEFGVSDFYASGLASGAAWAKGLADAMAGRPAAPPSPTGAPRPRPPGGGGPGGRPWPPGLEHGGIVKARRGGTLVRIGEGGRDEAIIPLGRGGQPTGGGVTINLSGSTFIGAPTRAAADAWAQAITEALARRSRHGGTALSTIPGVTI